jgi:hypothetical protein
MYVCVYILILFLQFQIILLSMYFAVAVICQISWQNISIEGETGLELEIIDYVFNTWI